MPAKRALSAALALLLAVSFAAPSGARADSDAGFEYTVTGGVATVTGCTGTCPAALVIPGILGGYSVTSIGDYAFTGNALTSVTIPNSVTSIGVTAFYDNDLTSVTIGSSVTSIGTSAFNNNALTSVTIPNSVTSIGGYAFASNALTTVTIPNSVTVIDEGAFASNALTTVTIPNSVTTIGDYAFEENLLTSVTIPNSVTSIGRQAFRLNALTTVTIPNSVTTIGINAFAKNLLTTVTIGNSVTSIGIAAFRDNALTTVTIPNSVMSIGDGAFYDNALTTVTFLGNAPTAGTEVFGINVGLTSVTRSSTATGWGATWSGVPVVTDELPPETTLDVTPNSTTSSLVASFEFSGSDDLSPVTFECSVDGGSYVSCASPFSTSTLGVGPHMFAVRAVDAVGNIDPTPASYTWTIETALPETNRDGSAWATLLAFLAALSAIASVDLRLRGAKRA